MQRTTYFNSDNKVIIPEDKNKPIQIEINYFVDVTGVLKVFPWEERLTVKKGSANIFPPNTNCCYSIFEMPQKPVKTEDKESFEIKFTYKDRGELYQKVCFLGKEEIIKLFLNPLKKLINPVAFVRIEDIILGRKVKRFDKIKTFFIKGRDLMIAFYEEDDVDYLFSAFYWFSDSKMGEEVIKYLEKGKKIVGVMLIPSLGPINNIFFFVTNCRNRKKNYLYNMDRNKEMFPNIIKHFIQPKYMKSVLMKFELAQ